MQIVSVNKIVSRHKNKNAIAEASGVVGLLVIIFDEQPLSPDTNPIVNVIKTGREQQQQQHHLQQQLHSGWSVSDLHGTRTWFSLLTCPMSCTAHILSTACTNKIAAILSYHHHYHWIVTIPHKVKPVSVCMSLSTMYFLSQSYK